MLALTVDFDLIAQSMKDLSRETSDYYLDRRSAKVVVLSRTLIRSLVEGYGEVRESLPDWDARMIPVAREIVLAGSTEFVRVPEAFGKPEHRWMAEFAKGVQPLKLRERLQTALRGRGACRRFKEILREHPAEMKSWVDFCELQWEKKIQGWLETIGIIAVSEKPKKVRTA